MAIRVKYWGRFLGQVFVSLPHTNNHHERGKESKFY